MPDWLVNARRAVIQLSDEMGVEDVLRSPRLIQSIDIEVLGCQLCFRHYWHWVFQMRMLLPKRAMQQEFSPDGRGGRVLVG